MSRIFFIPMPIYILDKKMYFPPVTESMPDGMLAIGGDLSVDRLLLAYRSGIFPWFDGDLPMWWSPDPRFVLFPDELVVSHSMKPLLRKEAFRFSTNTAFDEVIENCSAIPRFGQGGTWITPEMIKAYKHLHARGFAKSAEAWNGDRLVGGLYGIRMGKLFFGESMFSLESNASKYAFIRFVQQLQSEGVVLIDCQVYTPHLESLGARMIARKEFLRYLDLAER
ncbi:leucyl/phenylalanyl-tRNA--protein transferase [Pollutibacter soli]|uniref:leucyl/phenylalanyl-tRNA--protein transferase n=1 Tax=Pollutibacter soli TaxID=3034157 RepID=UPI00301342B5